MSSTTEARKRSQTTGWRAPTDRYARRHPVPRDQALSAFVLRSPHPRRRPLRPAPDAVPSAGLLSNSRPRTYLHVLKTWYRAPRPRTPRAMLPSAFPARAEHQTRGRGTPPSQAPSAPP
ncbi:hypothetical protein HETIRDRAFT_105466 [Heterobasidion irregulare TC 32-1]|uniref:Uncharacterized protein n=1 Tax=Heterobasidion irregulare (strain TC 32-1) TaxID=747525 RepID=W4JV35_HETIT|nr:uncharacterized protein HETIRDRAFT_105466 [Heterobasidion irregulare TC 32-1]ETW77397.1 hypothetical protein HETIRDRAFT_105466 [Heterobasidion irregulare TC 32-1]